MLSVVCDFYFCFIFWFWFIMFYFGYSKNQHKQSFISVWEGKLAQFTWKWSQHNIIVYSNNLLCTNISYRDRAILLKISRDFMQITPSCSHHNRASSVCVTLSRKGMMCVFCTSSRSLLSEQSLGLWRPHPQIPQLNIMQDGAARSQAGKFRVEEQDGLKRKEQNKEMNRWSKTAKST